MYFGLLAYWCLNQNSQPQLLEFMEHSAPSNYHLLGSPPGVHNSPHFLSSRPPRAPVCWKSGNGGFQANLDSSCENSGFAKTKQVSSPNPSKNPSLEVSSPSPQTHWEKSEVRWFCCRDCCKDSLVFLFASENLWKKFFLKQNPSRAAKSLVIQHARSTVGEASRSRVVTVWIGKTTQSTSPKTKMHPKNDGFLIGISFSKGIYFRSVPCWGCHDLFHGPPWLMSVGDSPSQGLNSHDISI